MRSFYSTITQSKVPFVLSMKVLLIFISLVLTQVCYSQEVLIENTFAMGWPNGRGEENNAVDGNQSTYTWTTAAYNTSIAHIGIGFDSPYSLCRIRLWKDADGGSHGHTSMPKDLVIMYTSDTGPLDERDWTSVSGLVNGYQGTEFLQATEVYSDGSVSEDIHDSIESGHGWASLVFNDVLATGVCIQFNKVEGWSYPYIHYKVHEFEVYASSTYIGSERDNLNCDYTIHGNYPNPFNALTVISYSLKYPANVSIDIYDILGRHVETLVNNKNKAGRHTIHWNASDYSSGVYFYKLTANDKILTKRMMLLK
ncbi:MAG: T9SS type A sorting domain-containing protein [candidate division Zixibacteria bacterium]|nr:T9SS type A sorting domain-containing protein [candidate division Zixibacteria bacterium]